MRRTPLVWKADDAFNTGFSAQVANATYRVACRDYGYPAYVEVRDRRGDLRRLDLGNYVKLEQAQRACERHYAAGGDLSKAKKITT
jgi:hypothetical protein